jgi:glycosyltransferase involved in cell wall biosynthesis
MSRFLGRGPATVAVIGPQEVRWAQRRYPTSRVEVVPLAIDLDYWRPSARRAPERGSVLIVGDLASHCNQTGLCAVLDALVELDTRGVVRDVVVVSPTPPSAEISWHPSGLVRYLGSLPDVRAEYERADVVLVPSLVVNGVKSTVLQGWAMGTPVVTTLAVARCMDATSGVHLLAGADGRTTAQQMLRVVTEPRVGDALADAGRQRVASLHSLDEFERRVRELIGARKRSAVGSAP